MSYEINSARALHTLLLCFSQPLWSGEKGTYFCGTDELLECHCAVGLFWECHTMSAALGRLHPESTQQPLICDRFSIVTDEDLRGWNVLPSICFTATCPLKNCPVIFTIVTRERRLGPKKAQQEAVPTGPWRAEFFWLCLLLCPLSAQTAFSCHFGGHPCTYFVARHYKVVYQMIFTLFLSTLKCVFAQPPQSQTGKPDSPDVLTICTQLQTICTWLQTKLYQAGVAKMYRMTVQLLTYVHSPFSQTIH